jgi:hypothetical protein
MYIHLEFGICKIFFRTRFWDTIIKFLFYIAIEILEAHFDGNVNSNYQCEEEYLEGSFSESILFLESSLFFFLFFK